MLALALLLVSWGVGLTSLHQERQQVLSSALQQRQILTALFTNNLEQFLEQSRPRFYSVAHRPDRENGVSIYPPQRDPDIAGFAWFDEQFNLLQHTPNAARIPQGLLEHAQHHLQRGRAVFLGTALEQSRQGHSLSLVPVIYRVPDAKRTTYFLYALLVDLSSILSLYEGFPQQPDGAIQLRNSLNTVIACIACPDAEAASPSFHRLNTGTESAYYGFHITFEQQHNALLDAHQRTRQRTLTMLALWSLLILLITSVSLRNAYAQQTLLRELAQNTEENQNLISQLEAEKQRAFSLAAHDHLTGLPNRRMFQELVSSHLMTAKRSRQTFALLYLDLDQFKHINDSLGHHVGDELLQHVAQRLRDTLRASDVVARLGGDEFAIFITTLSQTEDAVKIADKVLDQLRRPFQNLEGHDIQVNASIGIALYPKDGDDVVQLCKHADAAMYQSKRRGRGCYTLYEHTFTLDSERLFLLEQGLPRAVQQGELLLQYQPKVALDDFHISGFEALVRWKHPELGLVPPNEFIPLAERNGFIHELGQWVAHSACQQLQIWRDNGYSLVPIAINVSARQLMDPHFPELIATILAEHDIPTSLLEIEITESMLMESVECAKQALSALNQLGIRLAIDDFGQGFSSLNYIKSFPVQTLKIDRSFIRDIRNSHDDDVIVSSIITLAHNLDIEVIAEGVENLEQLVHLKAANCDHAQGFFFSKPVGAADASRLLLSRYIFPD